MSERDDMASNEQIPITINDRSVEVAAGTTILDAAEQVGLSIPTLCTLPSLPNSGVCRICMVEVEDETQLQAACTYKINEPISVTTHTPRVLDARRMTMELLMARCLNNREPYTGDERFQQLAYELGIRHPRFPSSTEPTPVDNSSPAVRFNANACIQCGLCTATCGDMQQVHAISLNGKGAQLHVQPGLNRLLNESECTACGQCTVVCPTGSFVEQDQTSDVLNALGKQDNVVIGVLSPAVGTAVASEFKMGEEEDVSGKLVHALKQIGFDMVFSAGVGHDLLALETAFELRSRLESDRNLPLIISSCPSLVKQVEHQFPDLLPHLSVNRSPAQMFGRVLKTYYSERLERDASEVVVVQITPCLAGKYERQRHELEGVDLAVTSRELVRLLRSASGYPLHTLDDMAFDTPFEDLSGSGIISEVSGGTMEAVLRTFLELKTGTELQQPDLEVLQDLKPFREAEIAIDDDTLQVAVAYDLGHGNTLLQKIREDKAAYQIVEIMACPGGCAGGGGQPEFGAPAVVEAMSERMHDMDKNRDIRKPRENPTVNRIYEEVLKMPSGEKSQSLLHTTYTERGRY